MSTAAIDSGGIHRILVHLSSPNRTNSVGAEDNPIDLETNTTPADATATTEQNTWINKFYHCDRILSGGLVHLLYRLIDIVLLFIGLTANGQTCPTSNRLAITSICLLIFHFLDLTIVLFSLVRNIRPQYSLLTEAEKNERLQCTALLRGFLTFFKIFPLCFGTAYSFPSSLSTGNECELLRFCLGVVCLSSWVFVLVPPAKPVLPVRRSFIIECILIVFILIINCTYFGTVATAMTDVQNSTCIYSSPEDFYLKAPLKSYAFVGLILFACTTGLHIISLIINQLHFRLNRGRSIYSYYYAFQYTLSYFAAIVGIYYIAIGGLFLFQPRSGQSCRTDAPNLYRVLLIWEWIRILSPLILIPLLLLTCCLGVCFGILLTYCLPASITVPILDFIRGWIDASPMSIHPNPPATRENINAIPTVLFGKEPDPFNQTDCAICRTNFEANEQLKKLECGHLFHSECVTNWLLVTRICPVCRRRMSVATV